jgi:putative phosphoribosyl transferase
LVPAGAVSLQGDLAVPEQATGIVIFSHGSGSGRLSPRNQFVARELRKRNMATLLLDLLTEQEDRDYEKRFDINLLTQRLEQAVRFAGEQAAIRSLPVGLFGASTGAASALRVAASAPRRICAVVSRGGRPDLAGPAVLGKVRAPTLLIVGGNDFGVIELNESARDALANCTCQLTIVPGATHLFEEPGKLEDVAQLAADWFARHLGSSAAGRG